MESLFAGNFRKNLIKMQTALAVDAGVRDLRMLISAENPDQVQRALAFVKRLEQLRSESGKMHLDQQDFDQILNAYKTSTENELHHYFAQRIKVSPRKKEIVPRTANQLSYVKAIREKDVVFGIGPAGTGKTYLAMALAVSEFLAGKFDRIILTRPAVEAGENLGFLPGKLEEKINPYLRPLYDALYDMMEMEEAAAFTERGIIEVAPLAFMRGRTLNNAFIILDEAQNTTNEQMLMFLTRLGFRSKCVVAGDPSQVDLPGRKISGLQTALHRLNRIEEIGICRFTPRDVVRHSLVEKIINAYNEAGTEEQENTDEQSDI
ncbi:MAG: PhoH family protein [Lentisphaeria bacterium]|nr:PhoH family protein [Lentisphaeria bacterium]